MTNTRWGRWTLNTANACLETNIALDTGAIYQVPLYELNRSSAILDWIFQVQEKTWATPEDQGHLIDAIVEIFGRGFAGGTGATIDNKKILANRYGIIF